MTLSDIPAPCYCGCAFHGGNCFHCGCSTYTEDYGTDGPRFWVGHQSQETYKGQYKPVGGYEL